MNNANDRPERKDRGSGSYAVAVVMGLFLVLAIVILPFMPLLLALCEETLFHTRHIEDFCTRIGIHDELDRLYQPVLGWFQR